MDRKPILLVTRRMTKAVETRLRRDYDVRMDEHDRPWDAARLIEAAEGADALFVTATERIDADAMARLPAGIRMIATLSVGHEHIDLAAARRRGLPVTNTPDVLTAATADVAMLLILAAARRAGEGERLVRNDRWRGWTPTFMLGTEVTGKRLGILGMGRIGRALAQRARAFDMTIHYSNRSRLPAELEAGAVFHVDPEDLLRVSDIFSINCPATAETRRFLDARRIALLPDGAIVVNTARGVVVVDEALIAALRGGKLAAAGLDVFDGEPDINPGYRGLDNAFLLPHVGSGTVETRSAMGFKCLDNLDACFAGREPPDRVA